MLPARAAPLSALLPLLLLELDLSQQATPAPARRPAPAYHGDLAADFDEWLAPGAGAPKASPHLKVMTFYGGTCVPEPRCTLHHHYHTRHKSHHNSYH